MIITAIVACIVICAVVLTINIQRKQKEEFSFSNELILTDNINNKTTILHIPNYRDTFNNNTYISAPNILELAKTQLLQQDPRFAIQLYQDSLLYAKIDGECLYYILRRDMFPSNDYGMRFSTINTHDIATDSIALDKFDSILVPYHLFDAFSYPFDSNFPFRFALAYDKPIKISSDITVPIDTFANFYNSMGIYKATILGTRITVTTTENAQLFAINFANNYASFSLL